ncbi:NAD-binding protein [Spirulina subsalsa]|uniref:NAD-binding protein n=1 Tax=Spirulina subsalsa TaxID=54311 RepID=UPI0003152546|nr:NAD-binding protein [Spirulina subsalsa]
MNNPAWADKSTTHQQFLVIGLGSLGQHCVMALKEFGVRVVAVEIAPPSLWEFSQLPEVLDGFILGDSCQDDILQGAGIQETRAALIVTSNERVNAETALAIRQLNRETRLVVRSGKENLNQLLSETLGNFVAFEATELPAVAFAIAALGTDTLGFFNLEGQWLRVVKQQTSSTHPWCQTRQLEELNSRVRRVLLHGQGSHALTPPFYQWHPDQMIGDNDRIVYVETADQFLLQQRQKTASLAVGRANRLKRQRWSEFFAQLPSRFRVRTIRQSVAQSLGQFWQLSLGQQIRRVALLCGCIIGVLLVMGTFLFHRYYPETTFLTAFYGTAVLLLGGYADLFGEFSVIPNLPWWLQLFALSLTVIGTGFVGVLYALLTETLLSSKFQLIRQRPPIPSQNHVIVIGLGRIGKQVIQLLEAFQEPVVGIRLAGEDDPTILPHLPLITAPLAIALTQGNVTTAKSVVVATEDEMMNLEAALMVRSLNPQSHLAIRIYGQQLSQHLANLLPDAQVFCTYAVMAEAFAGAAFGEKILSLFRLHNQTILVTEYTIEPEDTLVHRLLATVAYGYGVVPLLHQKKGEEPCFMPSDEIRLQLGDRLIVLATIESLRRVELGHLMPPEWQVYLTSLRSPEAAFEGANLITRMTGYSLAEARSLMHHLPALLPCPLYHHQGQRLVRALRRCQVRAELRREIGN